MYSEKVSKIAEQFGVKEYNFSKPQHIHKQMQALNSHFAGSIVYITGCPSLSLTLYGFSIFSLDAGRCRELRLATEDMMKT